MTLDEFLRELELLVPPADDYKPHKYVALLAVLELIRRDQIVENRIYHNNDYRSAFRDQFDRYSGKSDSCRPHTPFFHLRTSSFWHLQPKQESEQALRALDSVGSASELDHNVEFAYLNDDVFELLASPVNGEIVEAEIRRILDDRTCDVHFYVDYAPPREVGHVLRVLSADTPLTSDEIAGLLCSEYGVPVDGYRTEWSRRLVDLGLASQARERTPRFTLSPLGVRLQSIQAMDADFACELFHYLHYSGYSGAPSDRKYLWSYRQCCQQILGSKQLVATAELAAVIQEEMRTQFPRLDFSASQGARFDKSAVGRIYEWIRALRPSPFAEGSKDLCPRSVYRHELAVLALDDVYRSRKYTYGDPVVMDDPLLDQIAGVFFLEKRCCTDLLQLAARILPDVRLADTLAGPSINLLRPFTIEDL